MHICVEVPEKLGQGNVEGMFRWACLLVGWLAVRLMYRTKAEVV